jgi:putative flippase GtrA
MIDQYAEILYDMVYPSAVAISSVFIAVEAALCVNYLSKIYWEFRGIRKHLEKDGKLEKRVEDG